VPSQLAFAPHACTRSCTWGHPSSPLAGGSWGSTLALAYAESHPERVTHLVLRGIFLLRKREIDWFYQSGADALFPDAWEKYLAVIPPAERGDLVTAYHKRLTSSDDAVMVEAAKAWSVWEGTTSKLFVDPAYVEHFGGDRFSLSFARIENHYFVNREAANTNPPLPSFRTHCHDVWPSVLLLTCGRRFPGAGGQAAAGRGPHPTHPHRHRAGPVRPRVSHDQVSQGRQR